MGAHPPGADAARIELAEVFARHGAAYQATHRLVPVQVRAMAAIQACRTAALGGHVERCDACGRLRYHYHSCRNRHCPKCQTLAKELIEFGANPRWLGGAIAATLVLHTWGQTLSQHLHLHCLIASGALAPDGHWITSRRGFLFPVTALSAVFRGKFLSGLKQLFSAGTLKLAASSAPLADATTQHRLFNTLYEKPWVLYTKRPFAGPAQVLDYLGRYTHRVAISNHRLVSCNNTEVRFRYKDYAHGNRRKVLSLEPAEFIRRFLLHVLPSGFMRIRHYGILANRAKREKLAAARTALDHPSVAPPEQPESVEAFWLRVAHLDVHQCPHCHVGRMLVIGPIGVPSARAPPLPPS